MKKLFLQIAIMTLLITSWSSTTLAQSAPTTTCEPDKFKCEILNTQEKSSCIFVITEEALGNEDKNLTHKCYRQITNVNINTPPNNEAIETAIDELKKEIEKLPDPNEKGLTNIDEIQKRTAARNNKSKYVTWYVADGTCTQNLPDVRCEQVMVYVSKGGTDLLYSYIGYIYRYAAGVGGLLAVLILVIAGIMYTTAGDNSGQLDKAKKMVIQSITGLIVLFLTAIILYAINPNFFVIS